jgi:hypothetical protein
MDNCCSKEEKEKFVDDLKIKENVLILICKRIKIDRNFFLIKNM